METLELLKTRRSIRRYKSTPVESEKIITCLEAARWAPSASNRQPWEFVIVKNEKLRQNLAEIHPNAKFVAQSPVVFVPLTNPQLHQKYHQSDTALATIQFMIQAHSLGLGTCWTGVIGTNFESQIKDLLEIPNHLNVLALVAVGYSAETRQSSRKPLESLIHYDKY